MSKEMREQINKVKNWKQFLNEQRVPYNELQDMVKDFLNKNIQFTVSRNGISFYVTGDIGSINYHTNGRGFSIQLKNCEFGGDKTKLKSQIKYGTTSVVIFPNENEILCDISWDDMNSMWEVQHEQIGGDALNEFTLNFFNFMKKIDFTK